MLHEYVNHFALRLRRKIWKIQLLVTSICHPLHNYSALWSTAWWYNYERQGRHTHLWEGGDHWPLPLSCPVHFHNDTRKNHHDSLILDLIKYTKCFSTAGGFLILLSWKVHNKKWYIPPQERKSHTPLGILTLSTCDTTLPVHWTLYSFLLQLKTCVFCSACVCLLFRMFKTSNFDYVLWVLSGTKKARNCCLFGQSLSFISASPEHKLHSMFSLLSPTLKGRVKNRQ